MSCVEGCIDDTNRVPTSSTTGAGHRHPQPGQSIMQSVQPARALSPCHDSDSCPEWLAFVSARYSCSRVAFCNVSDGRRPSHNRKFVPPHPTPRTHPTQQGTASLPAPSRRTKLLNAASPHFHAGSEGALCLHCVARTVPLRPPYAYRKCRPRAQATPVAPARSSRPI